MPVGAISAERPRVAREGIESGTRLAERHELLLLRGVRGAHEGGKRSDGLARTPLGARELRLQMREHGTIERRRELVDAIDVLAL